MEVSKNMSEKAILLARAGGEIPTGEQWQHLESLALADSQESQAFGINFNNVTEALRKRGELLEKVLPKLCQINKGATDGSFLESLWNLWLPLALLLAEHRQVLNRPLIQGILGSQGTGKTTLAAILKLILAELGYTTLSFSLDDLYKTYRERQVLQQQDPRLIWRGPPGTHDVELGISILDKLRNLKNEQVAIPRFDKSAFGGAGDRTQPEVVDNIDIVLFEGWFVGARPIDFRVFDNPIDPILTEADRQFARDMNEKLKDYLPLWERLDKLMVLYPIDYRFSMSWRKQAEQEMRATGKSGMSDSEIEEFVKYFWKALHPELFINSLVKNSDLVDLVIEIKADHQVGKVYQPKR
ncbi:glycerate kinase [Ancylothrix sp. C2]|uniref:glycerate kinase n=1 Tax=Ancylothrix sp. D3o TaxID=2953691 RepID=UPI0021BB7008|nr:glycerate kinase [Ancylothrix sp. D3o]MCT7948548.1 glycerate kinase [Ancylothrix sp. D3o]